MESLILVAESGGPMMFARIGVTGLEPPCRTRSILIAKTIIGDGGSWRGIDDCRALQCFVVLFTSVMTSLMSGSSPSLHLHGIPAPHWQPSSASQARSG